MLIVAKIEYDEGCEIGCGQGRNSKVYLSNDPQFGGRLAVKKIPKSDFTSPHFWSESEAMFRSAHEHVVPIQYACQTDDYICLAMPYFQRGSLTDRIKTGPVRLAEVIRIGQGILSGLAQIHIAGHLHFDIKPSNVLFSDHDQPMVADFGQSQIIGPHGLTPPPEKVYGLGYPPELFIHSVGTTASDVYQAGLTLYRAANGDPFFNEQKPTTRGELRDKITDGTFPDRDSFLPHVPQSLRRVLRKALRVDPSERYSTAREFASALGKVRPKRDWETIGLPGGGFQWISQLPSGPQLVVRLEPDHQKWNVSIHRERPGSRRAAKKDSWCGGLTHKKAMIHLRGVFEGLE